MSRAAGTAPLIELVEFGAGGGYLAARIVSMKNTEDRTVVGVGKSTLLHRFIHDVFEDMYDPTLEGELIVFRFASMSLASL